VLVGGRGTDLDVHGEGRGPSLLDDRHASRLDAAHAASHSVVPLQTQVASSAP
jgi:hypothetical protein